MKMRERNKYIMKISKLSNVDGHVKAAKERVNNEILFKIVYSFLQIANYWTYKFENEAGVATEGSTGSTFIL